MVKWLLFQRTRIQVSSHKAAAHNYATSAPGDPTPTYRHSFRKNTNSQKIKVIKKARILFYP